MGLTLGSPLALLVLQFISVSNRFEGKLVSGPACV